LARILWSLIDQREKREKNGRLATARRRTAKASSKRSVARIALCAVFVYSVGRKQALAGLWWLKRCECTQKQAAKAGQTAEDPAVDRVLVGGVGRGGSAPWPKSLSLAKALFLTAIPGGDFWSLRSLVNHLLSRIGFAAQCGQEDQKTVAGRSQLKGIVDTQNLLCSNVPSL